MDGASGRRERKETLRRERRDRGRRSALRGSLASGRAAGREAPRLGALLYIWDLYRRAAFSKAPRNRVFRCFRKEESAVRRERARRAKERRWRRKGCSASSGSVRRARWWFGNQVRAVSGFASAVDFWRFPFNDREILRSNALGPVLKPKPTIFGSASRRNQFGAD